MNAFRPPIITDKPGDLAEAELMLLSASHDNNALKERVQTGALSSRGGKWVSIDALDAASDFLELDNDYLRSITYLIYQLKQAQLYAHEHLQEDGLYKIEVHGQAQDLLRIWIQSRRISSKRCFLWIEYTDNENDIDLIKGWYCQCKAGAKVVGCCAHISSFLWYLGLAQHLETPLPKKHTRKRCLMNAADAKPLTSSNDNTDIS